MSLWGWSDTDALTFGKPITLTVEPKIVTQSLPVLSILTALGGNDLCLAAGFSPKEGTVSLIKKGENTVAERKVDNAVLSKSGTYYFAAFSDEIDTCKMKTETVNKTVGQPTTETGTNIKCDDEIGSGNETLVANQTRSNEIKLHGDPKSNTLQLVVTGLRLLLAKAVGLNIMMTVKALLV
ncbi:hypothetical protein HF521_019085 [Silurus meridionalis]|uniref:Uncharacterized protein n=1 Tax=Silurus meridionalis TaxID=175797 RepID=A0A8T0BF90_SILME|nr:hypothetical protein HF521_019085 [Silurus meridionalis]